ncbi:hypothetical protein FAM09_13420 [Niastella caeni]|uniref:Uncharacterized protein n=1 Tax=Niastella caeni TaxID=2569763 RepID=A0A4S8HV16_9BACT|nr:hypothetical protein [Niastella caeni]THU39498.1 hypothetical protein FAM09_13420 [Niastella caeni]
MKKIKIMLFSLALIAVVGGALAFKAKFVEEYCTTTTLNGTCSYNGPTGAPRPLTCTDVIIENSTTTDDVSKPFYCYTTSNGSACQNRTCTFSSYFKADN